jgi:FkbM family methyltransferase
MNRSVARAPRQRSTSELVRSVIGAIKSWLSRSLLVTQAAVVLRDQANTIVRLRLSDSPWVTESGEKWLIDVVGPECRTFVDVGGNRGDWTELMLGTAGRKRGLLFECSTSALCLLHAKFAADPELTIVAKAVGDQPGTATFYEEPEAGGTSSLVHGYSHADAVPCQVEVTTLDIALPANDIDFVDVLKIDVEGFDLLVLRGARSLLVEHRVGLVQFEYNQMWLGAGSTLREAIDLLTRMGYEVYLLNRRGLWQPDFRRYGEHLGMSNYVAVSPAWHTRMARHVRGPI